MRFLWGVLLIGLVSTSILVQPADSRDSGEPSSAEIEQLIDQLAAMNPEPTKGSNDLGDREPHIWDAVDELHGLGLRAFPQLIAHYDDDRYCCCEDSLANRTVYHRSVGDVCQAIVKRQVTIRAPWKNGDPRDVPGYGSSIVPYKKKKALKWWKSNRSRALWELQADNVKAVITANRQRLLTEKDAERRELCERAIRINEELALKLTESMSAIRTKTWRPYSGR